MTRSTPRARRGASKTTAMKADSRITWTCFPPKTICYRTCARRPICSLARSLSMSPWRVRWAAAIRNTFEHKLRGMVMTKMETQVFDAADAALDQQKKLRRKKLLIGLAATVVAGGTGYGLYSYLYASKFVSTDNAYTAVETAQVTPTIGGIVREVHVTDTEYVNRGDVVLVLDDIDARLALAQAEAELGRAERRVRGYAANDRSLDAQIDARISEGERAAAQLQSVQADFERARIDLERREALAASGSVSGD